MPEHLEKSVTRYNALTVAENREELFSVHLRVSESGRPEDIYCRCNKNLYWTSHPADPVDVPEESVKVLQSLCLIITIELAYEKGASGDAHIITPTRVLAKRPPLVTPIPPNTNVRNIVRFYFSHGLFSAISRAYF